jgi:hypothetical protein
MQKYKIIYDIPNRALNINEGLQKDPFYCIGDEIEYNQWLDRWGKKNDCYKYRMIDKTFLENNAIYFEEVK